MSWRWWLEKKAREMKAKSDAAEKAANRNYATDKYGTPRVVRAFQYKNFGETQNLIAFATLAAFIAAFVMGQKADTYAHEQFNLLSKSPPPASESYKAFVEEMKRLPSTTKNIAERYFYRIDYEQGHTLNGYVSIHDNNTVSKYALLGESMQMQGNADYEIVGKVLTYSDIQGSKFLFNEYGDVFENRGNGEIALLYEDGQSLSMRTINSPVTLQPMVVRESRSLFEIIVASHYAAQLQLLFLLIGILLTLYMVAMILANITKRARRSKKDGDFMA